MPAPHFKNPVKRLDVCLTQQRVVGSSRLTTLVQPHEQSEHDERRHRDGEKRKHD
jgi:hypothetical protein